MSTTLDKPEVDAPATNQSTQNDVAEAARSEESAARPKIAATILGWIPSVLVVAALGGLAWFGHHNDWKLPKFGDVEGDTASVGPEWCDSHGVPEDNCIVCQPGLIEDTPKLTYCREQAVHGCVLCNPELAETKEPTQPTAEDLARAERALTLTSRKENAAISSSPGSRIQFASIDAMAKAGVDVEPV